jgi:hypothetical protein
VAGLDDGTVQLRVLAERLREAGGGELGRDVQDAISAAVKPVLPVIVAGLPLHMPDRYAAALGADLKLAVRRYTGPDAGIRVAATAPTHSGGRRKITRVEAGVLAHPLFGDRKRWYYQTDGMLPDFFAGPLRDAAPQVREAILAAMHDTADKITRRA